MDRAKEIMEQDLKRFFKLIKRDVFNHLINKSTNNPFPSGKYRAYDYEDRLWDIFSIFKAITLNEIWVNPSHMPVNKQVVKIKSGNTDMVVRTDVTFAEFMQCIMRSKRGALHHKRIYTAYKMAVQCMDFAKSSGHEDLTVRCNHIYRKYLLLVFKRFNLNRRCICVDKSIEDPVMDIENTNVEKG